MILEPEMGFPDMNQDKISRKMNFEGLKLKRGFKYGENKEILCTYNPFILHGTFSKPKKPGLWYPIAHYWNASITGTNISSLQFFLYT